MKPLWETYVSLSENNQTYLMAKTLCWKCLKKEHVMATVLII